MGKNVRNKIGRDLFCRIIGRNQLPSNSHNPLNVHQALGEFLVADDNNSRLIFCNIIPSHSPVAEVCHVAGCYILYFALMRLGMLYLLGRYSIEHKLEGYLPLQIVSQNRLPIPTPIIIQGIVGSNKQPFSSIRPHRSAPFWLA